MLLLLVACQSTNKSPTSRKFPSEKKSAAPRTAAGRETRQAAAKPAKETQQPKPETKSKAPEPEPPPRLIYSSAHDAEFKSVFNLAAKGRWEEAEDLASRLYESDPEDASVQRLLNWVTKQRKLRREQAVEDKIREIDANNSVFNPTVPDLLKERKDRGLPPRKDVRDAVEQINSTPYIPDSYGRTIYRKGALFDLETEQGRMAKILDQEISVHLDNVTLEAIIFNVGQAEGINFVADKSLPAFGQKLSVNLDKVKLREFLNYVSRNLEVQFQVGTDLNWIVDAKDPKKLQEETRFYRLKKGFVLPAQFGPTEITSQKVTTPQNITTVTETQKINKFVNDGAPENPTLEKAVKELFTGSKYIIDFERNLIVARGTREQLEVLEHHAGHRTQLGQVGARIAHLDAVDHDLALLEGFERVHGLDQRRLARAGGAAHHHHLAAANGGAAIIQYLEIAIPFADLLDLDHRGFRRELHRWTCG